MMRQNMLQMTSCNGRGRTQPGAFCRHFSVLSLAAGTDSDDPAPSKRFVFLPHDVVFCTSCACGCHVTAVVALAFATKHGCTRSKRPAKRCHNSLECSPLGMCTPKQNVNFNLKSPCRAMGALNQRLAFVLLDG